jgi:hypothetical protein
LPQQRLLPPQQEQQDEEGHHVVREEEEAAGNEDDSMGVEEAYGHHVVDTCKGSLPEDRLDRYGKYDEEVAAGMDRGQENEENGPWEEEAHTTDAVKS